MTRIICMQDKFLHLVSVCIKENILLKKKKKQNRQTWSNLRWVATVSAYSNKCESNWNQIEKWKWKVIFENETICKLKKKNNHPSCSTWPQLQFHLLMLAIFPRNACFSTNYLHQCRLKQNTCITTLRGDIKVEVLPTALQAFIIGILAHLSQFY